MSFSSLLEVIQKGTKGACRLGYSAASVPMYIYCGSLCHSEGALYLLVNWKPCGPNVLDKLLKGFIVNHADLPRKGLRD